MVDWKAIGAFASVIVALVSVAGLMTIVESGYVPDFDTDRRIHGGFNGGGSHPDAVGDTRKYGELWDATEYFTSYDGQGRSEKIVASGKFVSNADWIKCGPTGATYEFYIYDGTDEDGEDLGRLVKWRPLKTEGIEDGTWYEKAPLIIGSKWDIPPAIFRLDGYWPDGAIILVELTMHCLTGGPPLGLGGIDYYMANDEARLIQGDGNLLWSKDRVTVGVDDNAVLTWFVPAVDSEVENRRAYKIFVTNENTGGIIYEEYVDTKSGSISIPITEDMAESGGSNRLIARLWNDIFQKDVTHVPVAIDGGFRAVGDEDKDFRFPEIDSIELDKAEYWEGETVELTITATNGTYPISHYFILCEIEGTEMVNVETTSAVYTFRAAIAGVVECEVTAYDLYGNPSRRNTAKATVENQMLGDYCDRYPDDPICTGRDAAKGLDWIETLILVLLVIALFVFVAFLIWAMTQIGLTDIRIMVPVIGLTLLAGAIAIGLLAVEYGNT